MRESSVVTSLEELRQLEEQRRAEEAEARAREQAARREAEERAMIEARERAAAYAAEDRESAIRAAVAEAQIEAQKHAQIEKSRMVVQLALQAEALAQHEAHARELATMNEARRLDERSGRGWMLLGGVAVAVALVAVILAARANGREPVAAVKPAPALHDDSAERTIARLEKELASLRAATPPAPVASASSAPSVGIHPQPKEPPKPPTGTKCPPGVHGVPLCP